MKFKILGVNEKELISLKKLIHLFFKESEFVDRDASIQVSITSLVMENHIKVIVRSDDLFIEETTEILTNETYDKKYLILACFYELLKTLTHKQFPYGVLSGIRPTKLVHMYLNQGKTVSEVIAILIQKYKVQEAKASLLVEVVQHQSPVLTLDLKDSLSIYINIPFCLSRCSYCTFTSYPLNYASVSINEYLKHLNHEIYKLGEFITEHHVEVTTIYVGGGTPTALNLSQLEALLTSIEQKLVTPHLREYTFESGRPDSLSKEKFELLHQFSVNRVSINPQTFHQNTLNLVKRNHTVEDVLLRYQEARDLNFVINMDLIIGLPNETKEDILFSLEETLKLNPEQITLHALAYKKGATIKRTVDEQPISGNVFDYCYQRLRANGYIPYYLYRQKNITSDLENIGFSKPEHLGLYNILMIEEMQNIMGLGCHASTKFLNHELILNPKDLTSYIQSSEPYFMKKLSLLESYYVKNEVKHE